MSKSELDELLQDIEKDYKIEIVPITVSGRSLRCLRIADLDEIILDQLETSDLNGTELPYWGKIWEASILLAAYLMAQAVVPGRQILEIDTGLGVSGLFAAVCGHEVTLSDYKKVVIKCIRANTLLNELDNVPIINIDWSKPKSDQLFDWIVGSEVVYHRPTYDSLVQFFLRTLKPHGTIFLAKSTSLPANVFFSKLTQYFKFKQLDKVMRSGDQQFAISLYAIKRKEDI